MPSIAWFLARRFIFVSETKNNINLMIKVCFYGILISTFSLALVSAIMNGFEEATHKKLQGIHADLIITGHGKPLKYEALRTIIVKEYSPDISALTAQTTAPAMIRGENEGSFPTLISLIGIDPQTEGSVTILPTLIEQPKNKSLVQLLLNDHVIIGHELAQQLGIVPGDTIELLFSSEEEQSHKSITLENHQTTVSGIFKTGIDEFDAHAVYCSQTFLKTLFPDLGITHIMLKVKNNVHEQKIIETLTERTELDVYSWKDLYPALVSALILEKYAMFFILALISFIATMNIISLLFMYITQKKTEIVLLKTLGIVNREIVKTFILIGMSITTIAAFLGLTAATIASLLLERYPFITLPDAYYVSHLPAKMTPTIVITVFLLVLFLSLCATWIPTRKIRSISVPDILKREL